MSRRSIHPVVRCTKNAYEDVQQTCYRTVNETAVREECYTVCRPVTETAVREETYCVQKPVVETLYRQCNYTVQRPVWEASLQQATLHGSAAVCETIQQECRLTVMKCVTETIQQERCYTVQRPETRTRCVQRMTGQWTTQTQSIPGPVIPRVVCRCRSATLHNPVSFRVGRPTPFMPHQVVLQQQIPYTVMVPQVASSAVPGSGHSLRS